MGNSKIDKNLIAEGVVKILEGIGESPSREDLIDTPKRVAKFYADWLEYDKEINCTAFEANYDEMIIVKDIQFHSLCAHHLLPFFGKAHVGYIPKEGNNGVFRKVLGLSKLVRIVNKYSRRLQKQEEITHQIANELMEQAKPQGVMVVLEAKHLCMSMRGVQSPDAMTVTSAVTGIFRDPKEQACSEFLRLIK